MQDYKLELSNHALHTLKEIAHREPELYKRLALALDTLQHDPFQGKALKGQLKGSYSYQVGSYRVIYQIYRNRLLIIVIDIGHRREIYR